MNSPVRSGIIVLGLLTATSAYANPGELKRSVERHQRTTEELYRWFHRHPELSGKETQTAARLAGELRALGATVYEGVGGTGVVAIVENRTTPEGPTILLRADMDGLPIVEATGAAYASENPGIMHGCGHDIHMATAVGTLKVLMDNEKLWRGRVMFVGQPAEEIGAGARAMLADPKLEKIIARHGRPDVALALHDSADDPAGSVGVVGGWFTANVDSVDIKIFGRGGHGARPHQTIDPIVIGSEIVLALQTIVSRRITPGTRAVVTVGKFEAGSKHNIIPPEATLLLTVRSYGDDVRQYLLDEITHVAHSIAKAHHAPKPPKITLRDEFTPAGFNDEKLAAELQDRFREVLGQERVFTLQPTTGGEDFALFARHFKIPGVQYRVGAAEPAALKRDNPPGLHSDRWLPKIQPTLNTSVLTMALAVLEAEAMIAR